MLETEGTKIEICRTFQTAETPHAWVLWPFSTSKGWCDKIEKKF
jgi:hypothetical protein